MKAVPCMLDERHQGAHHWRHGHITGACVHGQPDEKPAEDPVADQRRAWMRESLHSVLDALDGWIVSCRENCESNHQGTHPVSDCTGSFSPSDIRQMVDDAARDVGLAPLPRPADPMEYRK